MKGQIIEIDCAPGGVRPGDLLPGVLKSTGIEPREPVSTLFGNWTFDFNDVPAEVWNRAHGSIGKRLIELHRTKRVRFASWGYKTEAENG